MTSRQQPGLIVVGSVNIDLVIRGPRLPAPGETVLGGHFFQASGGKGANQAVAAARAGLAPVLFVAAVGDDDFGRWALAELATAGVRLDHVESIPGEATGTALILVDERGENLISVASGANARLSPARIMAVPDEVFAGARGLVACLESPLETVWAALSRGKASGLTTVLNPAPAFREIATRDWLALVDVLTPNRAELGLLVGRELVDLLDVEQAAQELRGLGCGHVIVTLGSRGCLLVGEQTVPIPASAVTPVDTTAAGDAFTGALAVALSEGHTLESAARWATLAAGISVTRAGAQPSLPVRSEIEQAAPLSNC